MDLDLNQLTFVIVVMQLTFYLDFNLNLTNFLYLTFSVDNINFSFFIINITFYHTVDF